MPAPVKPIRSGQAQDGDLRCECGKLLARIVHAVLELKCQRCKRVVLVVGGQRFEPAGASPCACTAPRAARPPPEERMD